MAGLGAVLLNNVAGLGAVLLNMPPDVISVVGVVELEYAPVSFRLFNSLFLQRVLNGTS